MSMRIDVSTSQLTSVTAKCYIYTAFTTFYMTLQCGFFKKFRQKQLSKMESAFFSVLTEQHSPSNFCHLRFHTQCHSGFLEMKQRVGLTLHTYLVLGTYVFQGETRYILHSLGVILHLANSKVFTIVTLWP